jgi:hypothetical protein
MPDNPQRKIIRPWRLPFIECPICTKALDISPIDRSVGVIPRHNRLDEPGQKCPASGKSLHGITIHNP